MNLFETAARKKYRFTCEKGSLTAEQLWDLTLLPKYKDSTVCLDNVAKTIGAQIRSISEESYVNIKPHPELTDLTNKLDLVKHIISVKMAEAEARAVAKARAEERSKLIDALDHKENQELMNMSKDDIIKRLNDLG
jgi:hypothetical protein